MKTQGICIQRPGRTQRKKGFEVNECFLRYDFDWFISRQGRTWAIGRFSPQSVSLGDLAAAVASQRRPYRHQTSGYQWNSYLLMWLCRYLWDLHRRPFSVLDPTWQRFHDSICRSYLQWQRDCVILGRMFSADADAFQLVLMRLRVFATSQTVALPTYYCLPLCWTLYI